MSRWSAASFLSEIGPPVSEREELRLGGIVAYRAWGLVGDRLTPVTIRHADSWDPGPPREAQHLSGPVSRAPIHSAPSPECRCGYWAFRDPMKALDRDVVAGKVLIWGRIEEHDFGYRAQYAYPLEIWAPGPAVAQQLRISYPDVLVMTKNAAWRRLALRALPGLARRYVYEEVVFAVTVAALAALWFFGPALAAALFFLGR